MAEKKLTGRIAAERIQTQSTPKPPRGAVERFLALGDCTGIISDVMDELGVPAGVVTQQASIGKDDRHPAQRADHAPGPRPTPIPRQ